MSSFNPTNFTNGLHWNQFLKAYREEYGLTHAQAMLEAGPAWKEYKLFQETSPDIPDEERLIVKPKKQSVKVDPVVIKRKDISRTKNDNVKRVIRVPAPPKNKKAIVSYVSDSESDDEPVVRKRTKAPPGKEKTTQQLKKDIELLKIKLEKAKLKDNAESESDPDVE